MRLNQVTVGCTDYAASVAFYRRLGLRQIVDSPPDYARFETDTGETFSVHRVETASPGTSIVYFECDDVDGDIARLRFSGIATDSGPRDERWGWREARLRDPDDNLLCLYQAGSNRRFPPWRISDKPQKAKGQP